MCGRFRSTRLRSEPSCLVACYDMIGSRELRMEQSGTSRRSLLTRGAAALATLPLAGGRALSATDQAKALPKVDVAANRITRKLAGLRPFRPSGFVIRHE